MVGVILDLGILHLLCLLRILLCVLLHLRLHLLLRLLHGGPNLVKGGYAIGFLVRVDHNHALALDIDDLGGPIRVGRGAQPTSFDVVRGGGRLKHLLLLLFGVSAGKDGGKLHDFD